MYPEIKAGVAIIAKDTQKNRSCGIRPGTSGYICKADSNGVSIYLSNILVGHKSIEAIVPLDLFGANFIIDYLHTASLGGGNSSYVKSQHYTKRFPEDFK